MAATALFQRHLRTLRQASHQFLLFVAQFVPGPQTRHLATRATRLGVSFHDYCSGQTAYLQENLANCPASVPLNCFLFFRAFVQNPALARSPRQTAAQAVVKARYK